MNNALSFDIEDWFQVENLKASIARETWDGLELRVEANTRKILALLREHDAKATFFVLGWVAERCPALVQEIAREGHEVASHGYGHHLVYDLTPKAFREDVLRSKQILEDLTQRPVQGYRAPSFSITPQTLWALDILKDAGFDYDSSVFPTSFHDRYGFANAGRLPFVWPNGLKEIPLAVLPLGKLAFPIAGGGYFRLFPYPLFRRALAHLNGKRQAFTFYLHPWELDPKQPRVQVPWAYRFRHYVNLERTEPRLRNLLRDFRFTTIRSAYADSFQKPHPARIRLVLMIDRIGSDLAGTENQLLKLIAGLDPKRFDKHLICFGESAWLDEHRPALSCTTHVFQINRFKQPSTYVSIARLVRTLRRIRPDIVHTFFPVANIVGVLAARLAGVRHVVSSRRDYGEWMLKHYLYATRLANRFATCILANSEQVRRLTVDVEKVPAARTEVIYNGIDLEAFRHLTRDEALKQSLGIPAQNKVIGIVANFRPMKRHETFVHAARLIVNRRSDVDFILLGCDPRGEGKRQAELEALSATMGVRDKLHFVGSRPDVLRFLSIFDIGVNCSEGEGLSNAIMEYMASDIPCVVSNSGGNPDLVTNDVNGVTFTLDDHEELATEIIRLLDDPERRKRYITNARSRLEAQMSLPAMLETYEKFYERLQGHVTRRTESERRALD